MSGGYILLHRGILRHELFSTTEPLCERMAWIWLLMQASYQPHKIRYHSVMISVGRGEIPTSYRKLKEAWKWSSDRVRRFLDLLESEMMINRKTGTGFLIITICNYDEYQSALTNAGTDTGTTPGTTPGTDTGTLTGTNRKKGERKEERKGKKGEGTRFALDTPPDVWIQFCVSRRPDLNAEMTFELFGNYWRAMAGTAGIKIDWFDTWQTWVLTENAGKGVAYANNTNGAQRIDRADKPTWRSEGERLVEKYRQNAEREEQDAIGGNVESNLCIAEELRQDAGRIGDAG